MDNNQIFDSFYKIATETQLRKMSEMRDFISDAKNRSTAENTCLEKNTRLEENTCLKEYTRLEKNTFLEDNTLHGQPDPDYIKYKLGTITCPDHIRSYEFLIEYNICNPSEGIYYGCKGLIDTAIRDEDLISEAIARFRREWNQIRDSLTIILNNTFPDIDFTQRFRSTDNANDNTYWPFWISLHEDEDIISVAARATRIIRNTYKSYLDGTLDPKIAKQPKPKGRINSETAFTQKSYDNLIEKIRTMSTNEQSAKRNVKLFEIVLNGLIQQKILIENPCYEKALMLNRNSATQVYDKDFSYLMYTFFNYLMNNEQSLNSTYKARPVPWKSITSLVLNKNGQFYNDNLKKAIDKHSTANIGKAKAILKQLLGKEFKEAEISENISSKKED